MRIVAGQYGGRKLEVPKNRDIRPTSDKVRGAIFNALRSRGAVENARVLDAFCGTGALGLEALSQGAAHCMFLDKSRESLELTKRNATALGAIETSDFAVKDSSKLGACPYDKFGLVFLDPPYDQGVVSLCLEGFQKGDWLSKEAFIVIEAGKRWCGQIPPFYKVLDEKIYGDTKVIFLGYR